MLTKIIFLTCVALVLCAKDGFCDPISAIVAIASMVGSAGAGAGAALAGAGAALGPAGVLAAGGLGMSAMAMMNGPDAPKTNGANNPAVPDPNAAAETANDKMIKDRRTLLLSGGDTMLTGAGGAPLLGVNLKSNLLGG